MINTTFSKIALTISLFLFSTCYGWQLQNVSLKEKIERSHLIVTGKISKITKEKMSDFGGVGNCYEGILVVDKFIKSTAEKQLSVYWCEISSESLQANRGVTKETFLTTEAIWFLVEVKGVKEYPYYSMPGNFSGIFPLGKLKEIETILKSGEIGF